MAIYTQAEIRAAAQQRAYTRGANAKLTEEFIAQERLSPTESFDVFLSHSTRDAEIVLGVKTVLEGMGHRVYVDWVNDRQLDRSNVTPATAELLRARMRQSRSLLYIHTDNTSESRWMPWELGYFDGYKGAVAIFPVTNYQQNSFEGQEYLGIYPYVERSLTGFSLEVKRSRYDSRNWTNWIYDPRGFVRSS